MTIVPIHMTSTLGRNEWFNTALPILVVPVRSIATAASCVPLAGKR
jgi:hypothetical protein